MPSNIVGRSPPDDDPIVRDREIVRVPLLFAMDLPLTQEED